MAGGDPRPDDRSSSDELAAGMIQLGEQLPFNRHLGVVVEHLERGRCRTRLPADGRLVNHLGGVHAIAELAPVELAGALAASTRLEPLVERGYVPVVGKLEVRYHAPAEGDIFASAEVGQEALGPALAAADAGERPRVEVTVEVTDAHGAVVSVAALRFVYLAMDDVTP